MIGGRLRGRSLAVPPGIRPTSGRVREALAAVWQHRFEGTAVLDLFAGSGAFGIEAVSRGARRALCLEASPRSLAVLKGNLSKLDLAETIEARRADLPRDLLRLAQREGGSFELVFADPPYDFADYEILLENAAPLLADEGELALEHSSRTRLPERTAALERQGEPRIYGESAITIYQLSTAASPRTSSC